MSSIYNPYNYILGELDSFLLKFNEQKDELCDEVIIFIKEYNLIDGDKIVAYRAGWDNEDFINNKITIQFYIAPYIFCGDKYLII